MSPVSRTAHKCGICITSLYCRNIRFEIWINNFFFIKVQFLKEPVKKIVFRNLATILQCFSIELSNFLILLESSVNGII